MKRARGEEETKGEVQGLLSGNAAEKLPLEDRFTPLGDIAGIVSSLRGSFQAGTTLPLEKRKEQLLKLRQLIDENKAELAEAVGKDMSRHPTFSTRTLIGCVQSTDVVLQKLDEWAAPRQLEPIGNNACQLHYVPRGVALIIGTLLFSLKKISSLFFSRLHFFVFFLRNLEFSQLFGVEAFGFCVGRRKCCGCEAERVLRALFTGDGATHRAVPGPYRGANCDGGHP